MRSKGAGEGSDLTQTLQKQQLMMDPSPPPPPFALQLSYPDSADSCSPRKGESSWDDPLPVVPGAKLRLMCSYGGHFIPRPHDKSLCYMGGETRMIVVDRGSSLPELSSRISRTLLNGRGFSLKYQLPNEDLDSLISVTTNEDLDNMVDEYDRITSASPLKSSRLRLFLFLAKPETAASMGALLDDAKSETWFVDALNGAGLQIPRGLSDSAAIEGLLDRDGDGDGDGDGDSCTNLEAPMESLPNAKHGKSGQEVQSLPSSPMVETASSFDSSSSSPSMANLPPIRVRVEDGGLRLHDQKMGLEEEFAYMTTMNPQTLAPKQDDQGFVVLSALPSLPTSATAGGFPLPAAAETGENPTRVFSDDERSDHGVRVRFRKPPLPLQPVQRRVEDGFSLASPDSKHGGGLNFPSPDSVASDSSIASASSFSRSVVYQDPVYVTAKDNKQQQQQQPAIPNDPKDTPDMTSQIQMPRVQDSCYSLHSSQAAELQQQPVVHASMHYTHHPPPPGAAAPISSYYPMYAAPPPQTQPQLHHQIDQQYPVYLVPITQPQTYNLPLQPNVAVESTAAVAPGRTLTPPAPTMVTPSGVGVGVGVAPIYPTKPEMAAAGSVYMTTVGSTTAPPPLVQLPSSNQFRQQQYLGFSQLHHLPQPVAAAAPNYAFEFGNPVQDQAYYTTTHHSVAPLPPQYQTLTSTATVAFSEASTQLPPP